MSTTRTWTQAFWTFLGYPEPTPAVSSLQDIIVSVPNNPAASSEPTIAPVSEPTKIETPVSPKAPAPAPTSPKIQAITLPKQVNPRGWEQKADYLELKPATKAKPATAKRQRKPQPSQLWKEPSTTPPAETQNKKPSEQPAYQWPKY